MFSDFIGDSSYDKALRLVARKHDLVAVVVDDKMEREISPMGLVDIHDAESGEVMTIDTSSIIFQRSYKKAMVKLCQERDRLLKRSHVDRIDVLTSKGNEDFVRPLVAFFNKRNHR